MRLASCLVYSYFELLHCFYVGLRRLMGAALVRLRLAYMHGTVSYFSFHHVIILSVEMLSCQVLLLLND